MKKLSLSLSLSDFVKSKPHKLLLVLSLALTLASASFLFVLSPLQTAQATFNDDFTVHTWGSSLFGQLGLGQRGTPSQPDSVAGNAHARNAPTEVPAVAGENEWRSISAHGNSTAAVTGDGRLFLWGMTFTIAQPIPSSTPQFIPFPAGVSAWDRAYVSAGAVVLAISSTDNRLFAAGLNEFGQFGTGLGSVTDTNFVPTFTQVPFPSGVTGWHSLSMGSQHVLAICNNHNLWAWGFGGVRMLHDNSVLNNGSLGIPESEFVTFRNDGFQAHLGIPTPTQVPLPAVDPPIPGWQEVFANQGAQSAALTTDGRMFVWGTGTQYVLGLGDTTTRITPTLLPAPSGGATWAYISFGNTHTHGLTSDGRLFAWGWNQNGQTGLNLPTGFTTTPAQVGTASNWTDVTAGTVFSVALNVRGEMFSWGTNGLGRLGQGLSMDVPAPYVTTPTRIGTHYWDSMSAGYTHTIAISAPPVEDEALLTKDLRKPYGTPVPNVTFSFTMVARSFNGDTTPSVINANFPAASTDLTRTVTIDNTAASSPASPGAGDVVTLSAYTNLLAGINFTQTGIFSWTITEVQSATGVGTNSSIHFSQAQYELRVYVTQGSGQFDPLVVTPTIHRLREADGTVLTDSVKVPYLIFVNDYRRTTTGTNDCDGAFWISKAVDGSFAATDTSFMFGITLIGTGLCDADYEFVGRVYTGTTFVRNEYFESGQERDIALLANQRIVFSPLIVGTQFTAVERAIADFTASVVLYVNGTAVNVSPNQTPNLPLSIGGPHLVLADLRNSADFTNEHFFTPPMGLFIGNSSLFVLIAGAGLMLGALLALKARKRIEELPIM